MSAVRRIVERSTVVSKESYRMSERLEVVVANALRIPESEVTDQLEFNGMHAWDSLNHVALMLSLEAEYGVTIPDDLMIELTSVRAIREFIEGQPSLSAEH
jgi:citrate synthase